MLCREDSLSLQKTISEYIYKANWINRMVKADVDHRHDSLANVAHWATFWIPAEEDEVIGFRTLRGGYSGTNYLLEMKSGCRHVIKIGHGYLPEELESQAAIGNYLCCKGYEYCCHPKRLLCDDTHKFVTTIDADEPAMMVNYFHGRAADFLIENKMLDHGRALFEIGRHLALLHQVPLDADAHLRTYHEDGLCFVAKHPKQEYLLMFQNSEDAHIINHPYVHFYVEHFAALFECLQKLNSFRQSVVHGDPFLDNALFSDQTGEFLGFVDFEDSCIGPSLLDIACCIVGNCFRADENGQKFDVSLLQRVLAGYNSGIRDESYRQQWKQEIKLLLDVMVTALILNATWRFQNFNIAFPGMRLTHGEKYLELQERVHILEQPSVREAITTAVSTLASPSL